LYHAIMMSSVAGRLRRTRMPVLYALQHVLPAVSTCHRVSTRSSGMTRVPTSHSPDSKQGDVVQGAHLRCGRTAACSLPGSPRPVVTYSISHSYFHHGLGGPAAAANRCWHKAWLTLVSCRTHQMRRTVCRDEHVCQRMPRNVLCNAIELVST